MQETSKNTRSGQTPKGRSLHHGKYSQLTDEQAKSFYPPLQKVDQATGEFISIYRYKARFNWRPEFIRPEKPDHYVYPDYIVIKEYYRKHGGIITRDTRFTDMLRQFIIARDYQSREVIVYDNTGLIAGNIMYHSVTDLVSNKIAVLVNYLFANRPNYISHPLNRPAKP